MEKEKAPKAERSKSPTLKIIEDSGIVNVHSNGGRTRTIIFKIGVQQFKISIKSESYDFQSYARLYKWTEQNGFSQVIQKNPKRDFNVDISYSDRYTQSAFDSIIIYLKKLAKDFI